MNLRDTFISVPLTKPHFSSEMSQVEIDMSVNLPASEPEGEKSFKIISNCEINLTLSIVERYNLTRMDIKPAMQVLFD